MSEYQHRLSLAVEALEALRNEEDGGWGASLHEPSSLVNTAEALSILRAAGEPYESDLVMRAVEFIGRAVREHPQPRPIGRGEWTRYPIYALLGLTEYEEDWPDDPVARQGIATGLRYLKEFTVGGGWGARSTDPGVSIFHTAQAVRALERLPMNEVQTVAIAARSTLLGLRLTGSPAWPNEVGGSTPSAAKTALSALALRRGNGSQREAAMEAAAWLYRQPLSWTQSIHRDPGMSGVRWDHMSFALCLQACVATGHPLADLLDELSNMNQLWDGSEGLWRDSVSSTSFRSGVIPSAAVVQTYQTIKEALGGRDPVELPSILGHQIKVETDYHLILCPSNKIAIRSAHQVSEPFSIGRGRKIIDQLIAGAQPGAKAVKLRSAVAEEYGGKPDTLRRTIIRINNVVKEKSGVGGLIELEADHVSLTTCKWEYVNAVTRSIVESDTTSQSHMATQRAQHGITFFTFDVFASYPSIVHGVFSRHGGVSTGSFSSLNTSTAVGDHPENVRENLSRIAGAVGFEDQRVFRPRLVHGDEILQLESQSSMLSTEHPEADAVVTDVPGILLMMSPADCAVVLLHDVDHSAIGMVHAGWKGIMAELPRKAISTMAERFGSRPGRLLVAVGPSVGPCHYRLADPAQKTLPNWAPYLEDLEDGRTAIDLPGMLIDQLLSSGIETANLQVDRRCTACNVGTFFSYWIDKPSTGRMAVALGLRQSR